MADLTTKYSIPKLTEKNYPIWAMMVETAAHSIMSYDILTKNTKKPNVPNEGKSSEAEINAYKWFYTLQMLLLTSISENCLYIVHTIN